MPSLTRVMEKTVRYSSSRKRGGGGVGGEVGVSWYSGINFLPEDLRFYDSAEDSGDV